jgi:hypothetical protein
MKRQTRHAEPRPRTCRLIVHRPWRRLVQAPLAALLLVSAPVSCSTSSRSTQFDGGALGGEAGGPGAVEAGAFGVEAGGFADGGLQLGGDGAPQKGGGGGDGGCTGALCNQSMIDNCAGKGMPFTTVTGIVYDPAGALPLYDVYVYIPSSTPDPIEPGNPTCTACEAPASGGPIIGALTDEQGKFTLVQPNASSYGVPSGTNIPLVIQTGKWRKQITVPTVAACATTAIPDSATPATKQLRLPANSSEGDMPIIAFTSGCDPAECFLRHIGISDSEFVAPTAPLPTAWTAGGTPVVGAGHVRFYTGNDAEADAGAGGAPAPASSVTGGDTVANTYAWWTSSANLLENDIIFNACECHPYDRGAGGYPAMDAFLNGGGRFFTTHYGYNWFAPPTGTADLQSVAAWDPMNPGGGSGAETDAIDQTFPKGMAFATWLQDNAVTTALGSIALGDFRDNVDSILPAGCEAAVDAGTGTCLSTQWIYNAPEAHPRYISFNTPVAAAPANQCGRAVFSDVHVSGTSNDATFPGECSNPDPMGIHSNNEKALEFLFFDLSTCVQNDFQPTVVPPPTEPK